MIQDAIEAVLFAGKVPYLEGPPGWGKSALMKALAHELKAKLYIVYLAQRAGNEIHGIPVVAKQPLVIDGKEYPVVEQAPPRYAVEATNSPEYVLIFFDEFNQVSPPDMGQVMSILSERIVGEVNLPRRRIALAAAGNPQELSAGGWQLPLPAQRRVVRLEMEVDAAAFSSPECFPTNWGYDLPPVEVYDRQLDHELRVRMRAIVASWVHANPDVFLIPKDISKMRGGWASPATCEDAADLMASVEQYVPSGRRGKARMLTLYGVLGESHGGSLLEYFDNLDVPDARIVLDDPAAFMAGPLPRLDKLYYFNLSLLEEVRHRTKYAREKGTKGPLDRARKSWVAAHELASYEYQHDAPPDLVCLFVKGLQGPEVKPPGVVVPDIVLQLAPLLATLRGAGVHWAKEKTTA